MSLKSKPLTAALCLCTLSPFTAQADSLGDTITVTATRQPMRLDESTADITILERDSIEAAGSSSLPELLAQQPGIQFSDNGGIGKASNLYLRGTESRHVLLLVDGIPLGSATSGAPSLASLPLANIERIEILRGPASALYGSDAVGGVIQVFTRRQETGELQTNAYLGGGSQGTWQTSAGLQGGDKRWNYGLNVSHFKTEGHDIKADRSKNPSGYNRDKDGYEATSVSGGLSLTLAEGHEAGISLFHTKSRNQFDSSPTYDDHSQDQVFAYGFYLRNRIQANWQSTLRLNQSGDYSDSYSASGMSRYRTDQTQWSWQNDFRLPVGNLLLALEQQQIKVSSTTDYTRRRKHVDALVLGYSANLGDHQIQAALRETDDSQFGSATTGNLGYGYHLSPELTARLAYGTAFKAPSFNQLYYPDTGYGGGNPDLVAEKSRTWEGGLNWEKGLHRASLTYYDTQVKNLIAGWPPVNINEARIRGTTLSYNGRLQRWQLGASLDFLKARDQETGKRLPRRADRQLSLQATYLAGTWEAGGEVLAVSDRYDDTSNSARKHMGGYGIVNAHMRYYLSPLWSLELQARNLTDKQYETSWGYTPAGAAYYVGLRYGAR